MATKGGRPKSNNTSAAKAQKKISSPKNTSIETSNPQKISRDLSRNLEQAKEFMNEISSLLNESKDGILDHLQKKHQEEITHLRSQLMQKSNENFALFELKKELEEKLAEMGSSMMESAKERDQLKRQLHDAEVRVHNLNSILLKRSKQQEESKLVLDQKDKELLDSRAHIEQLSSQIMKKDKLIEDLNNDLDSTRLDLSALKEKLSESVQQISHLEKEKRMILMHLNKNKDEQEQSKRYFVAQIQQMRANHESEVNALRKQNIQAEIDMRALIEKLKERMTEQQKMLNMRKVHEESLMEEINARFQHLIQMRTNAPEIPLPKKDAKPSNKQLPQSDIYSPQRMKKEKQSNDFSPLESHELQAMIQNALDRNQQPEDIIDSLINAGYSREIIEKEFSLLR